MHDQPTTTMKPTVLALGGVLLFAAGLAVGLLVSRYLPTAAPHSPPASPTASGSTAEDKFLAIADTKQMELANYLKSKDAAFSGFKATIADEKEDVQKRTSYAHTGKIEFFMGVAKKEISPDGKGSSQTTCGFAATYRYNKKDQRWELTGCDPVPANYATPMQETLEKMKSKLGPNHPDTLTCLNNLAHAYQVAGHPDKALPLHVEALEKRTALLGADHPATLQSMNNLAVASQAAGQLDKALALFEAALEKSRSKLGANHPETLSTMTNLALAYTAAKQPMKAIPLFREGLAVQQKQWGTNDPRYAAQLAIFALELLKSEQYVEAETMLRECLAIRGKAQPELWTTFNTKTMLGASLLGEKKYQDAEPLLKDGYEGMKAREKMIPPQGLPRLTEALERLVQLYEATGNAAEADRYRKELAQRKSVEEGTKK